MARYAGSSDRLVVCLSGVGKQRGVMPPYELVNSATDGGRHSAIFVSDKTRSWLNAPKLAELIVFEIEKAQKLFQPSKTSAVGNSMGGFMALELSRYVDFSTTLAIVPQFSVKPSEVPDEKRWSFFRNAIDSYRFPRIEGLAAEGCNHFVIHGGDADEFRHWRRFPVQKNVKHMIVPKEDHRLAAKLKAKGKLNAVVSSAIENRFKVFRQLIESVGGRPRADMRLDDFSEFSTEAML